MPGIRVLIVEDDADINQIVATHLARQGMTCTQAFSGSEARLLLGAGDGFPFDVVVSDLMLPGCSGEELVGLIRERDPRVPIIVISARTATSDRIDLLKLGADDYLVKPFDLDELVARIEVQLRHRGGMSEPAGTGGARAADEAAPLRFRAWELDPEARVLCGGHAGFAHAHRVQHPPDHDGASASRVLQAGALRAGVGRAVFG